MTIIFVGNLNRYSRSYQRFRALQEMCYDVVGLSFAPIGFKPGITKGPSLISKICGKLGFPLDLTDINMQIIEKVEQKKPDILWIELGLMIRPSTLKKVKKNQHNTIIVSCSEDDTFARHNQSAYYRGCLPFYDVVFTTKSYNCNSEELPALGARKVVFVDAAYDKNTQNPIPISNEDRGKFGSDVGFIGTFEKDRAEKMLFLAQNGIQIRVWGNGWDKMVNKHQNLKVENRPLYEDDYGRAICSTKINLCFLRKKNRDLQTSRTIEIPAYGGFMLTERTREHLRLFEEGKEVVFFDINSPQELLEKVKYYLAHDEERKAIAKAGRKRCTDGGYSHHDRLRYMVEQLQNHVHYLKQ